MRIRRLAKQNAPATSVPQPHVCEFNRSPWDIMIEFSPPSSPMLPPSPKVNGNAMIESSDASISVMEWEDLDDDVVGQEFDSVDNDGGGSSGGEAGVLCSKTDGRKWHCKREATYGHTLCEHHLALASKQSSNKNKSKSVVMEDSTVEAETGGGKKRVRTKKPKAAAAADPLEIYYYSGFGPRWGKRRGEDIVDGNNLSTKSLERETAKEPSSSKVMNDGLHYIEDEDEDEEEEAGSSKRKRPRKSVKARSLKSLM